MAIRLGINGMGRIGKLVFRMAIESPDIEVVQVNDRMGTELMAHLIKHDSLHGMFGPEVTFDKNHLFINGQKILVTNYMNPNEIVKVSGVDVVLESSGHFKTAAPLEAHIRNGAKKVILSCPPDDQSIEQTVVMGVNQQNLKDSDTIVSNASCTTNCVAMMLKVLIDEFGLEKAFMNTVHPTTNNQNLQDGYHADPRRARCAICNIIPTTSSAVRATQLVMPELKGRFDGFATRVPVADCSFVELTALLKKQTEVDEINNAFLKYSKNQLKNYLEYSTIPLVSSDITNNPHSAIFDSLATKTMGNLVQILAWYDNEFGYASRVMDLIRLIG